jgi:hypothetical protein
MLYVQMSRLDEMFESFGADTSLRFGIGLVFRPILHS